MPNMFMIALGFCFLVAARGTREVVQHFHGVWVDLWMRANRTQRQREEP